MPGKIIILLLSFLITACAVEPTHTALKSSQLPRLIPVRDFVANTDYNGHYRISPDGMKLAWKAAAGTREAVL